MHGRRLTDAIASASRILCDLHVVGLVRSILGVHHLRLLTVSQVALMLQDGQRLMMSRVRRQLLR